MNLSGLSNICASKPSEPNNSRSDLRTEGSSSTTQIPGSSIFFANRGIYGIRASLNMRLRCPSNIMFGRGNLECFRLREGITKREFARRLNTSEDAIHWTLARRVPAGTVERVRLRLLPTLRYANAICYQFNLG